MLYYLDRVFESVTYRKKYASAFENYKKIRSFLFDNEEVFLAAFESLQDKEPRDHLDLVFCHNDLSQANMLQDQNGDLRIIDFEHA